MENKEPCCENCIYWRNRFSWMESETHTVYAAECHRFPPSTNGHDTHFPKVRSTNWCGEHCGNHGTLLESWFIEKGQNSDNR